MVCYIITRKQLHLYFRKRCTVGPLYGCANASVTNGYIDFTNTTSDTYPMRIAMRSDNALGDLAFTIRDHSTPRVAVTQAGLVGIGTGVTAPNSRVQVAGITRVTPVGALTGSMILGTSNEDGVELNPAGTLAVRNPGWSTTEKLRKDGTEATSRFFLRK